MATNFNDAFDRVAAQYHAVRPRYPEASIDTLLTEADLRPGDCVVEFGAGTGILTRQLAERGLRVTAVEPGKNLLDTARRYLHESANTDRVRFVANTAMGAIHSGQLAPSYDGAVIGTARRWVDDGANGQFRPALRGLLRPTSKDRLAACVSALHNTTAVRDRGAGSSFDALQSVHRWHRSGLEGELPRAANLRAESFGPQFKPVYFGYELDTLHLSADQYAELISTFGPIVRLRKEAREALILDLKQAISSKLAGEVVMTHAVTLQVDRRKS